MRIQPRLTQTQSQQQKIVMTPKLQQAVKVLMMPQLELRQFIEQELNQNPLLDIEEESATALSMEEYDPRRECNEPVENIDREDSAVDIDWHSVFDDMRGPTFKESDQSVDSDAPEPDVAEAQSLQSYLFQQLQLAPFTEEERSIGEQIIGNLNDDGQLQLKLFSLPIEFLKDFEKNHLSEELQSTLSKKLGSIENGKLSSKSENDVFCFEIKKIDAQNNNVAVETNSKRWHVVDTINNKTYTVFKDKNELSLYQLTIEDIASELNCSVSQVEQVLQTIQDTFEPTGIAYRDLKETLSIQVRNQEAQQSQLNGQSVNGNEVTLGLAKRIIEDHLDDLLNSRISTMSQDLDVERDEIIKASQWIGTLSPYPGRYFSDPAVKDLVKSPETVQGIVPDIQIMEIDGEYQIVPMDNYIPRLRLNSEYINLMRDENRSLDADAKKWIQQKYSDAMDVLNSIVQRGRTIERVTEAIFKVQSDFLRHGTQSIKPLTLKTVADMTGVHESTVSRVTSNKYVQTPNGTYPLKFFFSNQIATTEGNSVSTEHVKSEIREMVRKEDPAKPLSDQTMSSLLKERGIIVARRTVQKYREELGILSSRQRKNHEK